MHSTGKRMNPFKIVEMFEQAVCEYTGAPYGVALESCSNALFLCFKYLKVDIVTLPKRTYLSVPNSIIHAGGRLRFVDMEWKGAYKLEPYPIIDAARRFKRNMYEPGTFTCVSFHGKKHLSIGRGGMILCDSLDAVKWFKMARFDGRHEGVPTSKESLEIIGYHFYMTPELAAQGLARLAFLKDDNPDLTDNDPDLSLQEVYKPYMVS